MCVNGLRIHALFLGHLGWKHCAWRPAEQISSRKSTGSKNHPHHALSCFPSFCGAFFHCRGTLCPPELCFEQFWVTDSHYRLSSQITLRPLFQIVSTRMYTILFLFMGTTSAMSSPFPSNGSVTVRRNEVNKCSAAVGQPGGVYICKGANFASGCKWHRPSDLCYSWDPRRLGTVHRAQLWWLLSCVPG